MPCLSIHTYCIYGHDLDKPQKNLSADVAKRDIAAIERWHLRKCHLTLDQVTFQWNGSTWGKASLSTCVTGQYIWHLKEVSAGRTEKLFPIFWPMVGSKQVAQELQEGGHVGWQREKSPFPHRPIPNVSPKNFLHISFANATSVAMTSIGQTIWIHTRRWNTACGGKLAPCPYISATRSEFHLWMSSQSFISVLLKTVSTSR